jgi:cation:H+ antiporter
MMDHLLNFAAIALGFVLLIWGADRFINGAAAIARHLGVSPLLIGLTIVGLGTSAPEILVSIMASWQGNTGMAIGNAVGSNIANIGLILGFTALIVPLTVRSRILRREYPIMLGVSLLAAALMLDLQLTLIDGLILLGGFLLVLGLLARFALQDREGSDLLAVEFDEELTEQGGMGKASILFAVGLVGLLLGSRALVWGAVNIATALGVSDLVIGLTIVAIGTSLPELAASVTSALKGEHEIAIGNVIGSNIFNLLTVLPVPGLLAPGPFDPQALYRDVPVMLALTLAVLIFGYHKSDRGDINRWEGLALLACFVGYQAWLYFDASGTPLIG